MKLPITILKDFEAELWKANRRIVVKDQFKGWAIDGINRNEVRILLNSSRWSVTTNPEWFKKLKDI